MTTSTECSAVQYVVSLLVALFPSDRPVVVGFLEVLKFLAPCRCLDRYGLPVPRTTGSQAAYGYGKDKSGVQCARSVEIISTSFDC